MSGGPAYRTPRVGGALRARMLLRADGTRYIQSEEALGAYPVSLVERLEYWAGLAPDRVLAAQRDAGGAWRKVTYAQVLDQARCVAQALVNRGLSAQRPVAILSGNDLEHLVLALGAMWAGIPYCPVSPAYSLISRDYGKLRHVLRVLTPGLIYIAQGAPFAPAVHAALSDVTEVVTGAGDIPGRQVTPWESLLMRPPGAAAQAARMAVSGDTIVKFLFTSGSTKLPKAVVHTHRMLCSNQQMIAQTFPFLTEEAPVLVDWLPWNHTFGGNHNLGIVLYHGGSLYIDEGKPTSQGIAASVRNLREVSPTMYFNVPRGFEEIARSMDDDVQLRESLFRNCKAMFYAGAGLSQSVWDHLDRLSERTLGVRVPMLTGLGMTETSPACTFAVRSDIRSGHIGLPCPGVEVKLAPVEGKLEIRFRGPHVMPGYWRDAALSRDAFDDEGYYRTGDAVRLVDEADLDRGLLFDGRIAEDFKLSSGTFVSVGPLRSRILLAGAPYVQDVVLTAPDRDEIGMMLFPRMEDCRRLAGLTPDASPGQVLRCAPLQAFLRDLLERINLEATGSASRVTRALWLVDPASIDHGEITDKGSINQRAVLLRREVQLAALYDGTDEAVVQLWT